MEKKGTYKYSQEELDRNKIMKMQQKELQDLEKRNQILKSETGKLNAECESQDAEIAKLYAKAEVLRQKAINLAKQRGINPVKILNPIAKPKHEENFDSTGFMADEKVSLSDIPAWNEMLDKANEMIVDDVILEDLLSAKDFQYCQEEIGSPVNPSV